MLQAEYLCRLAEAHSLKKIAKVISAAGPEVNSTGIGLFYQNFSQIQNMNYVMVIRIEDDCKDLDPCWTK